MVAAHHLDREPADVAHLDLAPVGQLAPLALEAVRVRLGRREAGPSTTSTTSTTSAPGSSGGGWREKGASWRPGIASRPSSLTDALDREPLPRGGQRAMTTSRSSVISRTV